MEKKTLITKSLQAYFWCTLLVISFWGTNSAFGQENEDQLKAKADNFFQKKNFVEATPTYLQLIALQPRNPEYNFKYGTCLLFNSKRKSDAIKYLDFATKSTEVDQEAFYYMGKAYHLNYQFDQAIRFYNQYKNKAAGKLNSELEVDRQIAMCENGKRLLRKLTDIVVIEKKEYAYTEFYKLYDLQGFGGDILVSVSEQSKIDKKKEHTPIIHFPVNAQRVFFASYGENESNGKQIYVKTKNSAGGWNAPELVKGDVNTAFDEDYPYMDPAGEYLYFSSKGHNSMGGYDVFKSKYNPATNSFGPAENLDFAISSADDDLFYIVDAQGEFAWFASARQAQNGKIQVYKVRVQRVNSSIVAVKGTFNSSINPENKKVSIEVADVTTGRFIGSFSSDKSGNYLISFPKGGKYEYTLKIEGSPQPFKIGVTIPVATEFKPLKQQITQALEAGVEIVKVIDLFGENIDNPEDILAEIVQKRSELNPNANQFDTKAFEKPAGTKELFTELGIPTLLPLEAKDNITNLLENQSETLKGLEEVHQKTLAKIVSNSNSIKLKQNDYKVKVGETNVVKDPKGQYLILQEAENQEAEISRLENQNKQLIRYSDSLAKEIETTTARTNSAKQIQKQLAAVTNDAEIVKVLNENKSQLKAIQSANVSAPSAQIASDISVLKKEKDKLIQTEENYKNSVQKINTELSSLKSQLNSAREKDKSGIQNSINSKENELNLTSQEVNAMEKKIQTVEQKIQAKESELEFVQTIQRATLPAKPLTVDEAKKANQSAENQNYKTLKAYAEQQKTELEKNPALAAVKVETPEKQDTIASNPTEVKETPKNTNPIEIPVDNETVVELVTPEKVFTEIKPNFEKRMLEIAQNKELTSLEQMKMAQNEELEFEQVLTDQQFELEDRIKENPTDQGAKEQLKKITEIKKQVSENIDNRSAVIASLDPESKVVASVPRKETLLNKLKPGFEDSLSKIENDPSLTEIEKKQAYQLQDKKLATSLEKEIQVLEAEIVRNPTNTQAKEDKKVLVELQNEVQTRISSRQEELSQSKEVASSGIDTVDITSVVKPDYAVKIKQIEENTSLSENEKNQRKIAEEEKLQKSLDAEISKLDNQLASNSLDQKLLDQKQTLLEAKEQSQSRVDESKQLLVSKIEVKEGGLLERIDKTYQADIARIEARNSKTKNSELIAREQKLQGLLATRRTENENTLKQKDNPTLEAENIALSELIDASQKRIDRLMAISSEVEQQSPVLIDQALTKSMNELKQKDPSISTLSLESMKDLDTRRRNNLNEIGVLTSDIQKLKLEASKSRKRKARKINEQILQKEQEYQVVNSKLGEVEKEIVQREEKPAPIIKESAINETISFEEEIKIANSELYKKYYELVEEATVLKAKIASTEAESEQLLQENRVLLLADIESNTTKNQIAIADNNEKIVVLKQAIQSDKAAYASKRMDAENLVNTAENALQIQNLIARGITPISQLVAPTVEASVPSSGFEIFAKPTEAPIKKSIPVGVDLPNGLVYRVQVGAFAKPVNEVLFREFNPVSGEKLNNGIVRYMAGYFNSREAVLKAREQIQRLGYQDAFPVAYCDGIRIAMYEARLLEENGQCKPQSVEKLVEEVLVNVAELAPKVDSTSRIISMNDPGAYNQAPGAAKAIAVEKRLGLFFTVQVGVYNKPVPVSQVKNMEPLISKRLPNGQIRYSAGIFQSVQGAQPKKQEAVARGISDAFITAYYKGERIGMDEARKLLAEFGNAILEKIEVEESKTVAENQLQQIEKETERERMVAVQKESKSSKRAQFVSKKEYEEFPKDVLSRYNENGTFYYDALDRKVKSIVYKNTENLPQVYFFRKDLDTVFTSQMDTLIPPTAFEIKMMYNAIQFSGEVGDWLIRMGYQREIIQEKERIVLKIIGIQDALIFESLTAQLKNLGFVDIPKK